MGHSSTDTGIGDFPFETFWNKTGFQVCRVNAQVKSGKGKGISCRFLIHLFLELLYR